MPESDAPRAAGDPPPPDRTPAEIQRLRLRLAISRIVRWTIAVVLTAIALFLGIVPGVPGVPLFLLALFLVAPDFPAARRLVTWMQRRIPKKMRRAIPKRWRRTKARPR